MLIAFRRSDTRLLQYSARLFVSPTYDRKSLLSPTYQYGCQSFIRSQSISSATKDERENEGLRNRDLENNIGLKEAQFKSKETGYTNDFSIASTTENNLEDSLISPSSSPYSWMVQLDVYLPLHLRVTLSDLTSETIKPENKYENILRILEKAQVDTGEHTDLLTYMTIQHRREKAVLHLIDHLLKPIANRSSHHNTQTRGYQIVGYGKYLNYHLNEPVPLKAFKAGSKNTGALLADEYAKARESDYTSSTTDRVMSQIWFFLGNLVVKASSLRGELGQQIMNTFYLVLARIHNCGLVPKNIYSDALKGVSSAMQRPPILQLLSSRILTALSDAVWRSHSDNLILESAELGVPYEQIGKDPPGGRFRLKVRDMGPEVWLEFILWCCVEGGFGSSAARIIRFLRLQTDQPWFAVHWLATRISESRAPIIDWDRVKLRHGGSVGLIEGYSRESPFVEMPTHTISAEVIVSIVEALINSISTRTAKNSSAMNNIRQEVEDVVSFLEPHGLPADYFDYLTVRVLQTDAVDPNQHTDALRAWVQTFSKLRKLQPVEQLPLAKATLIYGSILDHSAVQAAVLHQSLQASIHGADVHHALEAFAQIQQLVDQSKLQMVGSFLEDQANLEDDSNKSSLSTDHQEFINSYGQLPPYRRAAFLNLVADSKLIGLGTWLLYTHDVDGPVIPSKLYSETSVATSVVRYAAASNDENLLNRVIAAQRYSKLKPSINLLRSLINASVTLFDFDRASELLSKVQIAQAGGYSPANIAYLSSSILRLESEIIPSRSPNAKLSFGEAVDLLKKLLAGNHLGSKGDFSLKQSTLFRNQIGQLLRIFACLDVSILSRIAKALKGKFPSSNDVRLEVSTFNILLDSIVENLGVDQGKRMWDLFCQDPRSSGHKPELTSTSFDEEYIPIDKQSYRQQDHDHHDLSGVDRGSRITRNIRSRASRQLQPIANTSLESQDILSTPFGMTKFPGHDLLSSEDGARISADPIVIPDVQTLRILVRGALRERHYLAENAPRMIGNSYQTSILRWAAQVYYAFGWSNAAIERETQQRLDNAVENESSTLLRKYDTDDYWRVELTEHPRVNLRPMFYKSSWMTKMPLRT